MRAYKHIGRKKSIELQSIFPSLSLSDLHDDDSILKYPISFWDKWYGEVEEKEEELNFDCDRNEELRRYNILYGLASDIVNEYEVFGIFGNGYRVKAVRSKEQLLLDLEHHNFKMRPILIPSLCAIYYVTWDFTAFIYSASEKGAAPLLELAQNRGLKSISSGT